MQKVNYDTIKSQIKKIVSRNTFSEVYLLRNGEYLKIFTPIFLMIAYSGKYSIEAKINSASKIDNVPEIIIPNKSVYHDGRFVGYIIDAAKGINYNKNDDMLSLDDRKNLYKYAQLYHNIEDVIIRANQQNIVFPDLLTCDNIFIDKNGKLQFIDYDGIQVGDYYTFYMSTSLGDVKQYEIPKYKDNQGLYRPNLDKKSLIYLYFLTTFNVDLNRVGIINPFNNQPVTLDMIFYWIGLDDYDFAHKVWLVVNEKKLDNEYLGNSVFDIADKYRLDILDKIEDRYVKKLVKK